MITTSGVNYYPALRLTMDVLGSEKIMFGIDYPFGLGLADIEFMDTVTISDSDREKIYYKNAEQLFRIS